MTNERFDLKQVVEKLELASVHALKHRRNYLRKFLESHEYHGEKNKVYIDKAGLKILEKAEQFYQEDEVPFTSKKKRTISDLDEFRKAVEEIEEAHGAEVIEKGEKEKILEHLKQTRKRVKKLEQELEELKLVHQHKTAMDKVRDSIIAILATTEAIDKEGLEAILKAINILEQAEVPHKKRAGLTPKE